MIWPVKHTSLFFYAFSRQPCSKSVVEAQPKELYGFAGGRVKGSWRASTGPYSSSLPLKKLAVAAQAESLTIERFVGYSYVSFLHLLGGKENVPNRLRRVIGLPLRRSQQADGADVNP